ncbi:MAG: hypothetical protein MJE66_09750 [Proteobacteria bacterium]|nr:hypothetical protein [Pseudomonadota bacterium]
MLSANALRVGERQHSIGRNALRIQFHPEATGGNIEHWLVGRSVELANAGIAVPALRAAAGERRAQLEQRAHEVANAWLSQLRPSKEKGA